MLLGNCASPRVERQGRNAIVSERIGNRSRGMTVPFLFALCGSALLYPKKKFPLWRLCPPIMK